MRVSWTSLEKLPHIGSSIFKCQMACVMKSTPLSPLSFDQRFIKSIIHHYGDVIMDAIASQITSLTIVYSIVYSDADQRKHQSSASLAFVRWIHRGPVNSPHKWPVTRKMFPFYDVIMLSVNKMLQRRHLYLRCVIGGIPCALIQYKDVILLVSEISLWI